MSCETLRNRILARPDPRELPAAFRSHLDGCPACAGWWRTAVRVEELVARLPVPAPSPGKKDELLAELAAAKALPSEPSRPAARGFPVAWVAGLAASVLVVAASWSLVRGPGSKPPVVTAPTNPLLESVVRRNIALAQAETPAERLTALGRLADDIRVEARDLARVASPDELRTLAGWYEKLVGEGLVPQAERLPPLAMEPAAKAALLRSLAGTLTEARRDTDELVKDVPPGAQESLRRIAESAREGQEKLRRLAAGGV